MEIVALVEDLAFHFRMMQSQQPDFAVLLGNEFLIHRGDFNVLLLLRQVEVRREMANRRALLIKYDVKGRWFVFPVHAIEVKQFGELPFTVVSELDQVGARWFKRGVD